MTDRSNGPGGQLHCVVRGRVQGVGFRWYVRETARRLGLAGSVQNLSSGEVVVRAAGSPTALASLRVKLAEGPPGSDVEAVEDRPLLNVSELPAVFTILRR